MFDFFFDTADIDYISNAWEKLNNHVDSGHVRGITTNPNAMAKIERNQLAEWEEHLPKLCELVSNIRGDNKGVVYVQMPNSNMTPDAAIKWAKHIHTFTDGQTKLGLKIPPFKPVLEVVNDLNQYMETNVTGVADCATALNCFSYNVRYVSIIPGRMEEQGVDAKAHIAYVNQRSSDNAEIIAGSMRTIAGLKWVCEYGTVPTVGTRVWDKIFTDISLEELVTFGKQKTGDWQKFAPMVTQTSRQLEVDFFDQMDGLGKTAHEGFVNQCQK